MHYVIENLAKLPMKHSAWRKCL